MCRGKILLNINSQLPLQICSIGLFLTHKDKYLEACSQKPMRGKCKKI